MSNEMIERVARAIAPQAWANVGIVGRDTLAQSSRRKASLKHAKAAIQAMRKPTLDMVDAFKYFSSDDLPATKAYQRMIDAALKE